MNDRQLCTVEYDPDDLTVPPPLLFGLFILLEKKILKFRQFIFAFNYYLPLEKGVGIPLNKFESLSLKDALRQV